MHLSEDVLQQYLDGELPESESRIAEKHLNECANCGDSLAEMRKRANANHSRLDVLSPVDKPMDGALFYARVMARKSEPPARKWRWKPAWAAAIAISVLVAGLYFRPVRAWATEFLSLFRVQQIAVLQFDPANLRQLEKDFSGSDSERRMEKLLSDDAQVVERGKLEIVSSANDAARIAGFGVRFPGALVPTPQIQVHPAVDISFSVDVERLQAILDDAGRKDIRIPADLDGEMIRIGIPRSVTAFFGKCPDLRERKENQKETKREEFKECKILAQLPSPTVVAPPTLNIAQLGTEMLKLFGLTDEQARQFSESIDWTSTLVVPLPVDHRMKFSEVDVNGVKGSMFASRVLREGATPAYRLLWIRDGILYALMGHGTSEEALSIARSI